MTHLARLADRVLDRPLLITRAKAEVIFAVLEGRIGLQVPASALDLQAAVADLMNPGGVSSIQNPEAVLPAPDLGQPQAGEPPPPRPGASRFIGSHKKSGTYAYRMTESGVAVIDVMGTLVNRGAWIGASSGLTSYEGLAQQIRAAAADPNVKGILLDMDSPGGEAGSGVLGAGGVPAVLRQVRGSKPVVSIANDLMASAGYAIGSAASEVWATDAAIVGSIGVVMLHLDRSRQMANAGITPTFITAGAHKVDGNSFEPLTAEVLGLLQAEVDRSMGLFVATVAANRPKLAPAAIRATEARVYNGPDAVAAGLADATGTFEEALASLEARIAGRVTVPARTVKAEAPAPAPAASADPSATVASPASEPQPPATPATTTETPMSQTVTPATPAASTPAPAVDQKARIAAIIGHSEAKGRAAAAQHLAFQTDMSAEDAGALLATMPKDKGPDPVVGANVAGAVVPSAHASAGQIEPKKIDAASIYARRNAAVKR